MLNETRCKFCAAYAYRKYIDDDRTKRFNLGSFDRTYRVSRRVALISVSKHKYKDGTWGYGGRYTQEDFILRYCPSCGRSLKTLPEYKETTDNEIID